MRIGLRFAGSLLAAWCVAGSSRPAVVEADEATAAGSVCPMDVPDTSVFALDLDRGAGLAFITADRVDQLRARVQALAELQNRTAEDGTVASVELIEGGAILVLHPGPSGGPDEMDRDVLAYAERLAGGDCPMTRDRSALVAPRRARIVPGRSPLPATTVPGVSTGPGAPGFLGSLPTAGAGF